jgi:universal stress protein E
VKTFSNILVIVDPTATEHPAVRKAALMAEKFKARLELFVCETKASRDTRLASHLRSESKAPFVNNPKPLLEAIAAPLRAGGLDVTTEAIAADPLHAALIDRVKHTCADLVVKDTHHHWLGQRTFLTNTDWEIIRACPVPLLLTKAGFWSRVPRVVAAIDPGHVNDKPAQLDHYILDLASSMVTRLGGELHVLHGYLPTPILATAVSLQPVAMNVSSEELVRDQGAKLKEVRAIVSDYAVTDERIHLEVGGPSEVLPRVSRILSADIVVMGAVSRSGLKRLFIGSTAEDVLEYLPCDALILKPPDFAELLPF